MTATAARMQAERRRMDEGLEPGLEPVRPEHTEGSLARSIENQTAKLPSDLFLWAAGGAMLGSLGLQCLGQRHTSLFVGQWVAPFLVLGLYNKLVKVAGSDPLAA